MKAARHSGSINIDGNLFENEWKTAIPATGFIQHQPNPGRMENNPTIVKVLYDNSAIYIGAVMKEVSKDSILRELGSRDTEGNTDLFGVFLDTYNDKINAYGFALTPGNVQLDARYSSNGQDFEWNTVWESKVILTDTAWIAEIRIPFSAIRFSNQPIQNWGINFARKVRRTREFYFWNFVNPAIDGLVNQEGILEGIENIISPIRLSVSPYLSGYYETAPKDNGKTISKYRGAGGMDVKYGLNEGFTLDMTLIPDYGQVLSDNIVLNLTPYEVKFNENRQFFTEGTELFNKGDFFYSRRIGGVPINYYESRPGDKIIKNPVTTQLYNATKISGRTEKDFGLGIFNAVSAPSFAEVIDSNGISKKIETQPLTNYNIIVADQSLKNNSYITLVNTNAMRNGDVMDANLTGGLFEINDRKNNFGFFGKGALSQLYYNGKPVLGHTYSLGGGKKSGNFTYELFHNVESNTYDPNDLGLLFSNNEISESVEFGYAVFEPFWKFNGFNSELNIEYAQLYYPRKYSGLFFSGNINATTRKFLTMGIYAEGSPYVSYDYFEARVQGRFYRMPENILIGGWLSPDYRKKFIIDLGGNYQFFNEKGRKAISINFSPRYRINNQLTFIYRLEGRKAFNDKGWVNSLPNYSVLGNRELTTVTSTLNASYIFTSTSSLTFRCRHYWSNAEYKEYLILSQEGRLKNSRYNINHNRNFNVFNIDMVYVWWFAPGSQLNIVWKNAIFSEEIFPEKELYYFDNITGTLESPSTNSLSVKFLYFIDYAALRQKNSIAKAGLPENRR